VIFNAKAEQARQRLLKPWVFRAYLWRNLPLAAWAGLGLEQLDLAGCAVSLPGGWRTRNPFQSTYFAAQAMAAEMSTGAPAMVLVQSLPASVSMILRGIEATFTRRIQGRSLFTFSDVPALHSTVELASISGDSETFTGTSVGRGEDGEPAAEFKVTWSFKRRA
jgi:hypothetical protein